MSTPPNVEMIKDFIEEVGSYIPTLIGGLESLRNGIEQEKVLEESYRLAHTIKGASSLVGLRGLSSMASQMEEFLEGIIERKCEFTGEAFETMQKTVELFQEYCRGYMNGGVASRSMLKETVIAFRKMQGLSTEEDEQTLKELLESIPETEGIKVEGNTSPEKSQETDTDTVNRLSKEPGGGIEPIVTLESAQQTDEDSVPQETMVKTGSVSGKKGVDLPPELLEGFYEEAEEHLEELGRSLSVLENQVLETIAVSSGLREEIRRIRRSVHTLKGAAAVIGFQDFANFAHSLEDLLDWLFEEAQEITPEIVALLTESLDLLERLITNPQVVDSPKAQALKKQYQKILRENRAEDELPTEPGMAGEEQESIASLNETLQAENFDENLNLTDVAEKLPHLEDVEELGARFTKSLRVDMTRFDDLVNLSGELIIALSSFDQKMEAFKDSVNDLELYRERFKQIARDLEVSYEVEALEQLRPIPDLSGKNDPNTEQSSNFDDFDTLELDRYSELNLIIRKLNESAVDVGALHTQLSNLYSEFDGRLTRQRVILSELQDKMMRARMTPISIIADKLRRTVREVAGNLDKKVQLVIRDEGIELDKLIWEKIADPLMHLLRNAVDHGVESQALRDTLGKPPVATIRLDISREGNQVILRLSDDGAGLDYDAIRATIRKMQLSDKVDQMSEEELSQFIFYPGFSTSSKISEISGRGVGMDVVKENIQNLKGIIQVASPKGQGTQFAIRIPLTLAAVKALLFSVRGQTYAVALNEISEIIRMNPDNILGPNKDALRLKDEVLPLFHMANLLGAEDKSAEPAKTAGYPITLVVETGGRRGTLVIDSLVGQKEIVIKSLGSHLQYVKGVSGATIMGDGSVIPILNLDELLWSQPAIMENSATEKGLMVERPLNIMVVDDSVSIRQVVSRLMESQGWNVLAAKDGLEALDKLRESRPDLVVLDIEMPRMNGYEFLSAIKAQGGYEDLPVVMLTSRTAGKHRDKAKALGAKGFMVKPYNDDEFVGLILKLTGRRPA